MKQIYMEWLYIMLVKILMNSIVLLLILEANFMSQIIWCLIVIGFLTHTLSNTKCKKEKQHAHLQLHN